MNKAVQHTIVKRIILATALVAGASSAEAAALHRPVHSHPRAETVSVFAGPCSGGACAVYRVAVRPNGLVSFQGLAHTSVMGQSSRSVDPSTYKELVASLSPYRPRHGMTRTACATSVTSAPTYRITWLGRGEPATLEHSLGCSSPRDNVLNAILTNAPAQLGIEDWTTMQTMQTPASIFKPHIFYF